MGLKIIIVGAGIGGLTAALCLARSGHHVCLLEQAAEFKEVGAGIQCGANALHVFEHLDLLQTLKPLAVAPQRVEFKDYKTGRVLYEMPLGANYESRFHHPYWNLHRADLVSTLVSEVQLSERIDLHLNTEFRSYCESGQGIKVDTSQGQFEAQLLIGADGIRSKIRRQMQAEYTPRFTGNVAWRAIIAVDKLPQNWMPTIVSNFAGPKKHAVLYYLRAKQLVNLVAVVENSKWHDDSWMASAPIDELRDDFSGWHKTVGTFIDAIESTSCYRWALHDHLPLKSWTDSAVVLIGDAAHASLPFMAAGGAMAIEDARVLDRALLANNNIQDALKCYQATRLPRTSKIQSLSRKAGAVYHFRNRLIRQAAFTGMRVMAKKNESLLPSYNANTVKLSEF